MRGSEFDEEAFFAGIEAAGVRALVIGRRALIALGAPVLTSDYDLWIHIEDIEIMNEAAAPFDLLPTRAPSEARTTGRYVLENDERVDLLVARSVPTVEGVTVSFDDLWGRKQAVPFSSGVALMLPSIEDLILTKRFAARPRDLLDIEYLKGLLRDAETSST